MDFTLKKRNSGVKRPVNEPLQTKTHRLQFKKRIKQIYKKQNKKQTTTKNAYCAELM